MKALTSIATLAVAALIASQAGAFASQGDDAKRLAQAAKASQGAQGDYVKIASFSDGGGCGGNCGGDGSGS